MGESVITEILVSAGGVALIGALAWFFFGELGFESAN